MRTYADFLDDLDRDMNLTDEPQPMKTIVYLEDGAIEATAWADKHVADGKARYATEEEIYLYERAFERDDLRSDREVLNAVNASCSCGGKPLGEGCCPACEVWHRLHR